MSFSSSNSWYGLDEKNGNLRNFINYYEQAERASQNIPIFRLKNNNSRDLNILLQSHIYIVTLVMTRPYSWGFILTKTCGNLSDIIMMVRSQKKNEFLSRKHDFLSILLLNNIFFLCLGWFNFKYISSSCYLCMAVLMTILLLATWRNKKS